MPAQSKIEKYHLEQLALDLFEKKLTGQEIAARLTAHLSGQDTISQPTVSRFLATVRREQKEQTKQLVHDHIQSNIVNDLEVVDEVERFLVETFRNKAESKNTRADFGLKAVRVVEMKLKYALIDPDTGDGSEHPVDLSEFRCEVEAVRSDA